MLAFVQSAPVATVDEQKRRARTLAREQIERLLGTTAVTQVEAGRQALPRGGTVVSPAGEPLRVIRKRFAQIVFALDRCGRRGAHCAPMRTLSWPRLSMRPTSRSPATTGP